MASEAKEDTQPTKKSSKFNTKFKNGLKKLRKNSKKDNKPNIDTESTQNNEENGTEKKRRRSSFLKKKKTEKPKLAKLKLSEFVFPSQILPPPESWGELQYDSDDRKLHDYLETEYLNEIAKLHFFPNDILIRFTLSQRGMTPFDARREETEKHFKIYLKYHYANHYDDILTNNAMNREKSLSSLKSDVNSFGVFIYGQDKFGHPIFWDDGCAYSKDSNIDIFKADMQRVCLMRSRLMKRMHNMKLCLSQKYNRMIYKHCTVMDLQHFNAKQFVKDRKFHEQNTKDTADLFPESLHKLYIINAPKAFRLAWKVIQTFLHPVTVEKTKILGGDYIDELCKDIDLKMIPHKFGGIGPWEIVYGEEPLQYEMSTRDIKFNYDSLPKPKEAVPPRAAAMDMNKHKAKKDKQMKQSGLKSYDEDIDNELFSIGDDMNELTMNDTVKSAPIHMQTNNADDEKSNK